MVITTFDIIMVCVVLALWFLAAWFIEAVERRWGGN